MAEEPDAAERMYGYSQDEMVGQSAARIFPPGRASELVTILEQVRRGLRVGHFDTERVRKDGTVIEMSISVSPIRTDSGAVIGAATVARDVTEHNHLLRLEHELAARLAAIFEASDDAIIGKTLAGGDELEHGVGADVWLQPRRDGRAERVTDLPAGPSR
jgi:two-component system, OmpR family, sensor histidine kinase VicK